MFLENDATQTQQYSKVWHYEDWAKGQDGYSITDIGIDLVTKLRDEEDVKGFNANSMSLNIRYQDRFGLFYFMSSTNDFTRLMLIDTSIQPIGKTRSVCL